MSYGGPNKKARPVVRMGLSMKISTLL